jgi:hypothetical protein
VLARHAARAEADRRQELLRSRLRGRARRRRRLPAAPGRKEGSLTIAYHLWLLHVRDNRPLSGRLLHDEDQRPAATEPADRTTPARYPVGRPGRRLTVAATVTKLEIPRGRQRPAKAGGPTVRAAIDGFLHSPNVKANPNTLRAYTSVLDRVGEEVDSRRKLAGVHDDEIADALTELWGDAKPATWNRNRAAVGSWLAWCDRLITGRERGPLFLSEHRPRPYRLATTDSRDICPETGRVRLGYNRARVLLARYADGTAPAPPLRRHPPRRGQRLRQRHHGQDRAQEPAVGAALRQARPCGRPRSHRNAIEPAPRRLIRAHGPLSTTPDTELAITEDADLAQRDRVYLVAAVLPTPRHGALRALMRQAQVARGPFLRSEGGEREGRRGGRGPGG